MFKKGEVVRQVPEQDLLRALLSEVAALTGEAVVLPVRDSDPLGVKVEALKVFLEKVCGGKGAVGGRGRV